MRIAAFAACLFIALCLPPTAVAGEIRSADVLGEVRWLHAGIEAIRLRLGVSGARKSAFDVSAASSYEVYYQALALFHKSNWLAREFDRSPIPPPPLGTSPDAITPAEVLVVIQATHNNLRPFLERLHIAPIAAPAAGAADTTPTDVYRAILETSQALNLLLRLRIQPRDVYRQVTLTTAYVSRMLNKLGLKSPLPYPDAPYTDHTPRDVFRRLASTYTAIRQLAEASGQTVLELTPRSRSRTPLYPGDTYDLAALLLSELAYLYARFSDDPVPPLPPDPGAFTTPSDVYRQVKRLDHHLLVLLDHARQHPGWIQQLQHN